jgi:high affinity cGMP-specific 3',5'-cyclic phosphodiesterase 9
VRGSLESILNLMTKDVYRPALERVMQSELDPVAMSLLQSYFSEQSKSDAATPPRKLSRKQSRSVMDEPREDELYAGLDKWDCPVFPVEQEQLIKMVCIMYTTYQPEELAFDSLTLHNFVEAVAGAYLNKPYHSFRHAFDVTQTLFYLVGRIQASDAESFSNLEICAMLTACLCHDVGHPGRTNKFLVQTGDKLALIYNDRSVLEQMHCSKTFAILLRPGCNIFAGLSKPVYAQVRSNIVACILGTDMGEHFSLQTKVETAAAGSKLSNVDRMAVLVHACDISNVAKPWETAYEWSRLVTAEFFDQGDAEKAMQMPVEAYMDRTRSTVEQNTANFITFVCRKWFVSVAKIFPVMGFMVQQMEENLEKLVNITKKVGE